MKTPLLIAALALLGAPVLAHASCNAVKTSIDGKLKAKNLSGYSLDVVAADAAAGGGKVVGHCEGGKQIVYTRGAAAADTGKDAPAKKEAAKKEAAKETAAKDKAMAPAKASADGA